MTNLETWQLQKKNTFYALAAASVVVSHIYFKIKLYSNMSIWILSNINIMKFNVNINIPKYTFL